MRHKEVLPTTFQTPFSLMRRLSTEIERMFDEFDFRRPIVSEPAGRPIDWLPPIEVFQKENELVARIELPGLKKEEVKIEITPEYLTLSGERKQQTEEKEEGFLRTERYYGTFFRAIPLPEGANTETAKAVFKDGVLEIKVPVIAKKPIGRRTLNIEEPVAKKELVGV